MQGTVTMSFSCSTYVSAIKKKTGEHVKADNEVEVPGKEDRYVQITFVAYNFYSAGKPRFKTIMLQAGNWSRNGKKFNKIWFIKAFGS